MHFTRTNENRTNLKTIRLKTFPVFEKVSSKDTLFLLKMQQQQTARVIYSNDVPSWNIFAENYVICLAGTRVITATMQKWRFTMGFPFDLDFYFPRRQIKSC